jgi:hypothetical protein
VITR